MDANELGRWTRFAAKDGIGKCTAIQDCVAEETGDLMFMKDDEITVLMQLPGADDRYLGYCEGVVGRFSGSVVRFHGRLKKPVMAKRSSTAPASSRPSSSMSATAGRVSPGLALRSSPSISRSVSASTTASALSDSATLGASSPSPAPSPLVHKSSHDESFDIYSISQSSMSTGLESGPRTPAELPKDDTITVASEDGTQPSVEPRTELNPDITLQEVDKAAESGAPADDDSEHRSYLFSEPSTRISIALSDGEVGIGLSLLQDFVNGGDDDSEYSDEDPRTRVSSRSSLRSPQPPQGVVNTPTAQAEAETASRVPPSASPTISLAPQPEPISHPPPSPSIRSFMSKTGTDSEYGGDDWDGASDIYENYRYSRFSVASKMSRLSKMSMHTGFGLDIPPPIPVDSNRPSLDGTRSRLNSTESVPSRQRLDSNASIPVRPRMDSAESVPRISADSARGSAVSSPSPLADNAATNISSTAARAAESKHVPSPLTFAPEITSSRSQERLNGVDNNDSPLLHATFGSPGLSSSASLRSLALPSSPSYSAPTAGVATALRQRFEMERDSRPGSPAAQPQMAIEVPVPEVPANRRSHQPIVVEDDNQDPISTSLTSTDMHHSDNTPDIHASAESASALTSPTSPSFSQTSSYSSEKKAMQASLHVMNPGPAPPPPYTPSSSNATPSSSTSIPSGVAVQTPYNSPPQARSPSLQPAAPGARQSLFLPHPHAPKPTASSAGPLYGRATQPPISSPQPAGPQVGSVVHTLHMALSSRYDVAGRLRRTTIYGKLEQELSHSIGPVPISFTLEPPNNVPANYLSSRPSTSSVASLPNSSQSPPVPAPLVPGSSTPSRVSTPDPSDSIVPTEHTDTSASKVIPRANFFPKAPTARPRSRSFSGFDSSFAEIELPKEKQGQSSEDILPQARSSMQTPPLQSAKRSKSASASITNVNATPQRASVSHGPVTARSVAHKPSPLSLSQNNVVASPVPSASTPKSPTAKAPTSPLAAPPLLPSESIEAKMEAPVSQNEGVLTSPASPTSPKQPPGRSITSVAGKAERESSVGTSSERARSLRRSRSSLSHKGSAIRASSPQSPSSTQGRRSAETDASHYSNARSVASPTPTFSPPLAPVPLGRSGSLRSKLSLPTLRIRNTDRVQHDDRSPTSSLSPSEQDQRTVQVKDMDFELVQPTALPTPLAPSSSEDLLQPLPSPVRPDGSGLLRAGSPASSTLSASTSHSRQTGNPQSSPSLQGSMKLESTDVEAHRQRELKWISTMSSVPAAQSRRSKKIRKLIQEGVPSSVRYLVWAHLADSKSKRVDKIYNQLSKRERVAASPSIERDIQKYVSGHPSVEPSSLNNLLQAYLIMVPDVQYSRGLVDVAGCLLQLSPEEDAFWTFISLMDTHIRPYFSATPVQLEIDASLFGRAAEAYDSIASKRVFVDLAVHPIQLCRPWFTTLFVEALPAEYQYRVWDIFLFEGIVFLFRVGIAILSCCKRIIMDATGRDDLLRSLLHPPASVLPSSPDAFVELAFSVKIKDDDIRKQRNKKEAQAKRQTQARSLAIQPGTSMPNISLPKT